VTLLFVKYAREVAKALPSDQAHLLRGSEKKRTARASNGLALGLIAFDWLGWTGFAQGVCHTRGSGRYLLGAEWSLIQWDRRKFLEVEADMRGHENQWQEQRQFAD
jgi:hypothetical protein